MKNQPNHSFPLKDLGYSNALGSSELPRHRWYFVKEAFAPDVVEQAILDANCSIGETIIDPFCGSGTVPLSASLNKRKAVGFEVNPFLSFVTRTKLLQAKPVDLDQGLRSTLGQIKQGQASSLEELSTFCEQENKSKWLFNRDVLRSFEGGWTATANINPTVQNLLRLALLGAAMDNCNAFRDGKCLRYKKQWEHLGFNASSFSEAFEKRMAHIREDMRERPHESNSMILSGDCRQLLGDYKQKPFKLCVTSPPYLNSFDYSDVYRPELFLGKFVRSNDELRQIRMQTLRSHLQVKWHPPTESAFGVLYKEAIEHITSKSDLLWNPHIPLMIQAYFEDMKKVLHHLRQAARPDAQLWLIVSTSAYAGTEIPVDLIIADIGVKVGWYLKEVGVLRHLRSSGQHWRKWSGPDDEKPHLRESVVIMTASPNKR